MAVFPWYWVLKKKKWRFERILVMRLQALLILVLLNISLAAQRAANVNLVPNPGFEEYSEIPDDWFYTGSDFTRVMRYWESATGASPDVYGPKVYVPRHWRDKGFGQTRAHGGQSMVGLTLYGCHGGKPHCREYIQTQLIEPLVPGQRYEISYWVLHLPNSLQINNLSAGFTPLRSVSQTDEKISLEYVISNTDILSCPPGQWLQCRNEFHAQSDAGYMIIGNFRSDEETRIRSRCPGDCLPFAYYYVDDVVLRKLPPILDVPIAPDDLSFAVLEEGKTIKLNYIFFDSGKADFLPRSFRELYLLLDIMRNHPEMSIEVHGHTDNLGTDEFNQELSVKRAQNVVSFLTGHGIDARRIQYQGFASMRPISDNLSEEGRSKNRRVEFHIIRM
ncbi:MAG TPA: OmpA family protein [Saprospiraceae bacterium]|nr:OmpA family protein [Saprospiraceae bacterium]